LTKIRQGVAVVFGSVTASGHVAYVERVDRDQQGRPVALHITEMNFSREPNPTAPTSCLVTKNFGVVTSRTVSLYSSGITGFWSK
jgi:surface antigen